MKGNWSNPSNIRHDKETLGIQISKRMTVLKGKKKCETRKIDISSWPKWRLFNKM